MIRELQMEKCWPEIASEYDQEIPQSHTTNQHTVQSNDSHNTQGR